MRRDQRNQERLTALIAVLSEQGVISQEIADELRNIQDHGEGQEIAE